MSVTRQWFQPGEGIAREVITADIQRYLGNDALVRPGEGTGEYQGVQGYWITAYRNLTSQMVADLKLDSQRWRTEVSQGRVSYQDSRTHQSRQYYGPTGGEHPAPAPAPAVTYQQPQRPTYPPQPAQQSYQQESSYTYAQPQAHAGYAAPSANQAYQQPAYNQPQGQIRTQPNYTYTTQPGPGQDPHPQYQQQDPRYAYQQPSSAPPAQQYQVPPQQPSAPPAGYYQASDGRQYPNPPPQPANHGRRRG